KLLDGHRAGDKTFRVHLDGYNLMPFLQGRVGESPRESIFYFDQAGGLNAVRVEDWKLHFTILEGPINEAVRIKRAWPVVINLRADPYEIMWEESQRYMRWMADNMWTFVPAQQYVAEFLATFREFPPVRGSSLSVDNVLQELLQQGTGR
ncbi:MAG: arylsulfatase, partial [Gemmatimonas sp. SG8_38_2]